MAPAEAAFGAPADENIPVIDGVWAGVKLPGGQYRKRQQLAQAHQVLQRIAAGEISSRQLPENAALLARHEHVTVPVAAVVLHLPTVQVGPRSAA
jgi:WhiB family transcriptional regulator, redox-sensing transcriptional regulator